MSEGTVPADTDGVRRGNPNEKGEEIGLTIEPLVDVTSEGHVVGHDVEHPHHLREDEHPVAVLLEPTQELVEQNHLARVHDDSLEDLVVGRRARLGPVKEEGVVAGTRRNGKGQQTRHRCGIAIWDVRGLLELHDCKTFESDQLLACAIAEG